MKDLEEDRVYVIRKVISNCNGHPKTLEKFCEVLNDDIALKTDHLASLTERLATNLQPSLGRISLSVVKMALLENEESLTCEIETPTGTSTLKDLISFGMYVNSLTSVNETLNVDTTLSLIALQHFYASSKVKQSEDASAISMILKRLLDEEFLFEQEVLDGKLFKRFHRNWELLYRELRKNTIVDPIIYMIFLRI
ncbi:hypothetical protein RclHR1_01120009 [Rhizophagus clarus]|uniref:Uncharacterized protein n=1 Tax=Rhizophagus clarus TaxID=94130 RepID=A0A2Z6QIQ6_9GLOM|nr:hypothetical protein RclHR1_01120009 [Rhizophagus clarus]